MCFGSAVAHLRVIGSTGESASPVLSGEEGMGGLFIAHEARLTHRRRGSAVTTGGPTTLTMSKSLIGNVHRLLLVMSIASVTLLGLLMTHHW